VTGAWAEMVRRGLEATIDVLLRLGQCSTTVARGNGFNQLFRCAQYLALWTCSAKQIESPNVQLTMHRVSGSSCSSYYYLFLQNKNDTPYSVVMTPFNPLNAPASRDLGTKSTSWPRLR